MININVGTFAKEGTEQTDLFDEVFIEETVEDGIGAGRRDSDHVTDFIKGFKVYNWLLSKYKNNMEKFEIFVKKKQVIICFLT